MCLIKIGDKCRTCDDCVELSDNNALDCQWCCNLLTNPGSELVARLNSETSSEKAAISFVTKIRTLEDKLGTLESLPEQVKTIEERIINRPTTVEHPNVPLYFIPWYQTSSRQTILFFAFPVRERKLSKNVTALHLHWSQTLDRKKIELRRRL